MTACLAQAEEVARTYRVALGISMYWRSSLAALRARRTLNVNIPHDFFIDNDVYCEVSDAARTEQAAASSIESVFILLGESALASRASRRAYPGDAPRLEAASDASGDGIGGVWFDPEEVRPMEAGVDENSGSSSSMRSFHGVEEWVDEGL